MTTAQLNSIRIQIDHSEGQGHSWKDVRGTDLPANIRQEIECEIIDGGQETCSSYLASNGQLYRW